MDRYKQTAEGYSQLATAYQDKFMDLDLYNDTYDAFCRLLTTPNASVFEIGCGPGNITRYLLAKRPDFKITGIDFAPNMVNLAKANNPAADFTVMDCREINAVKTKYDGIICGFTLPYLSEKDCKKLIADCAVLLNSGGVFYFSFVEGNHSESGYKTSSNGQHQFYFYYHRLSFLQEQLINNGFETVELIRKPYPVSETATETHLAVIARKNS